MKKRVGIAVGRGGGAGAGRRSHGLRGRALHEQEVAHVPPRQGARRARRPGRARDRDGDGVAARDSAGGQPGIGAHRRDVRGLRYAREEGPGDREARSAHVRGGGGAEPRQPGGGRRRSGEGARRGRGRGASARTRDEAVGAESDLEGRARHRDDQRQGGAGRGRVSAGESVAGDGVAQPGAGQPGLHDDQVADRRHRRVAQRRRRTDGRRVAAGADAVHHRRGPGEDAGARRRCRRPTSAGWRRTCRRRSRSTPTRIRSSRASSARSATRRRRCRTSSPTTRSSTSTTPTSGSSRG